MKIKRILSTALVAIMLFMSVVALIPPVTVEAAHSESSVGQGSSLTLEEIKAYVNNEYLTYNFNTAEQMLMAELEKGYLDYVSTENGLYTIYVNRYTGFLFYRNNYTGQILTSNPVNPGYTRLTTADEVMSQLKVKLFESSNSTVSYEYSSIKWSSLYGQLSVSEISGGLRVNYTLGDTSTRFLVPGIITAEDFSSDILTPMLLALEEKFEEIKPGGSFKFFGNTKYDRTAKDGYIATERVRNYATDVLTATSDDTKVNAIANPLIQLCGAFSLKDPSKYTSKSDAETLEAMYKAYPITKEGVVVYAYNMGNTTAVKREHAGYIKTYCPDYTMSDMYEDEKECGYVHVQENKPVIRCAIEYSFNEDGSLCVSVPSNSISFDESVYTLEHITPLQYFGYGDMSDDGFIFFPDGSGTVVEFDDFYNEKTGRKFNLSLNAEVFGQDYCYSTITGAHREQISMPVYGLVTTLNTNETTVNAIKNKGAVAKDRTTSGYFAILEEGAPLAELQFSSGGSSHKFGSVYASYSPFPSDTYDLSKTLAVASLGTYTIVSDSRYTGSYVTRITMLSDDSVGGVLYGKDAYYNTTYAGMAAYYRDYLKADGTLGTIELLSEDLPLYIEALGSMTIIEKFLTFPYEKSIPLTSFDDVVTMYKQLSGAKAHIQSLIDECNAKAADEEDELEKAKYLEDAATYTELLGKVEDISNINFRLTGFANDGMYYTYPTKIKWERAVGGKRGFKSLLDTANGINKTDGVNFGIYPEFDFMYISNTAMFDGISKNNTVSRMVDNRYASKQVYNAVIQAYESFFTMVISSDSLDSLYSKFLKDYKDYNVSNLSVSTLGSDINSNFDKDNSINRDQARTDVVALLDRMANTDGYSLMVDKGNIYTVKYVDHILNIAIDSSHFQLSSYAVPFVGMILHGHVSYAGSPINYAGSVDYQVLRSIENGAAPYYILCYQNTAHMKEDEQLNKYYGVNYETWYADLLLTYKELNTQIGDLQDYEITNHVAVIAEREKEESEKLSNYNNLRDEFFALLKAEIDAKLDTVFDELKANADYTSRVAVSFDTAAIIAQFEAIITPMELTFNGEEFSRLLGEIVAEYTAEYPGAVDEINTVYVEIDKLDEYKSAYSYHTTSECTDENYVETEYTLDNGKVVIVTYQKGNSTVRFVLNYNIYTVNVNIDGEIITLGKYEYKRL